MWVGAFLKKEMFFMKLGDIKIEALKLMFVSEETEFHADILEELMLDEEYRIYLANMPGAINRCFAAIEEKRILPSRCYAPDLNEGVESGLHWRFDLGRIPQFGKLDRVVRESEYGGYDPSCSYQREETVLVLPRLASYEHYKILYKPQIPRITLGTDNNTELEIPENIAVHIPLYIKGDLYRDDEPGEAAEARNWFEAAMNELARGADTAGHQTSVRSIYSMEVD